MNKLLGMLLNDSCLSGSDISLSIRNCADGSVILEHNSRTPLIPASNLKIILSGVVLYKLGSNFTFETLVASDKPIAPNGILQGNVYLKGFGDPLLVSENLWLLSKNVYLNGLREIRGDIIGDDSFFDNVRIGSGWKHPDRTNWYYAPIGALSLNFNTVTLLFAPAVNLSGIKLVVDPPTRFIELINRAKQKKGYYWVKRLESPGKNTIIFNGNVTSPGKEIVNIKNPPIYATTVFAEMLQRWGIIFNGKIKTGLMPKNSIVIASHRSKAISDIIKALNYYSNNFIAEQLLKTLGAELIAPPGTAEKGIKIIIDQLRNLGLDTSNMRIVDGSGLSPGNRVSSNMLSFVLNWLYNDPRLRYDFIHSLPIFGSNGTLKHRKMAVKRGYYIRAKSGRIARVNTISGYLFPVNSLSPLAFSVLINNFKCSHDHVTNIQDSFLEKVIDWYKHEKKK